MHMKYQLEEGLLHFTDNASNLVRILDAVWADFGQQVDIGDTFEMIANSVHLMDMYVVNVLSF